MAEETHEELADFAVKQAQRLGATYAEARYEHTVGSGFSLKNGVPQMADIEEVEGLGIRLIFHGAVEFLSTDWMNKEHVSKLVAQGIQNASASARLMKAPIELSHEERIAGKCSVTQKERIEDYDVADKVELLNDVEKAVSASGLDAPARLFSLEDEVTYKYYTNSEGSCIETRLPRLHFFYMMTLRHNHHTKQRHFQFDETAGYEALKRWKLAERIVDEGKALLKVLKEGVQAPKEPDAIVIAPEITGIACHESVGHPYEADRILGREAAQAGESFLTPEDIGMRIGTELVNVVDDPTLEGSAGYYLYDDEGVAARRKALITNGVVTEFLHNRESAWKMGLQSNGSARAMDYGSEPLVRMSNTFHLPGEMREEELFEGVKHGVYIKSFTEWNIDDRRMNQRYVSAEAYLIEKGEITKPIRRVVLETTTRDFWGSVDAVADNVEYFAGTCGKGEPMQGVPVWMGGPSLRLRGLRLGV